ncbi:nucleic acid-binding protein [Methanoregula sp.]|uniref:nucleic acid-binding protein n=1 Tax=Methanoregula sp. TaxID=2052170 RepID=UPI002BFB0F9B|nr:nucleic acid-binding protein [Methanoregula sp.]HVP97105.1 nucleic acid-binding protein [Methanoregula sp.]
MVLFHYALVDDLISQEEFERRVEQKIEECGDLLDEPTAAMLVVGALGRQHVKVRELSGKSSLFCFFAKVIGKTEPKEFDRKDGEKGWVATLLVGDETGTTRVVLWDERAGAVVEIAVGDVLEVIGRHPANSTKEIYALALRKATCEITCTATAGNGLSMEPVDLDVVVIGAEKPRSFSRRDGTTGELMECLIGDARGTARLVSWSPNLLLGIPPGSTIHITGAKPDRRAEGRAYSIDETSTVSLSDTPVTVPFTPLGSVADTGQYSVTGEVKVAQEPRSFTTKAGNPSWVKNIRICDGTEELAVVLWGDLALQPVRPGDRVEIFHGSARAGRFGGIELGVGRGGLLRLPQEERKEIAFTGTIIPGNGGTFIDNGNERYLIEGEYPAGAEIAVVGMLAGSRIIPETAVPAEKDPQEVAGRLAALLARLEAPLT